MANHFFIPIFLFTLGLLIPEAFASTFNEAHAASVVARVEQILAEPWSQSLDRLKAAFSSRWTYLFDGEGEETNLGLSSFVDDNATLAYIWTLMKPADGREITNGVDAIFAGFENGKFLGYDAPVPLSVFSMRDENASCPGIPVRCRSTYRGVTDEVTGRADGKSSLSVPYITQQRPWYVNSMMDGDVWTDPYVFASDASLGITAARRIETDAGQVLGVIGVDYKLSSLDAVLALDENAYQGLIFVTDQKGTLVASSVAGVTVDSATNSQVQAVECPDTVIAAVSQSIVASQEKGGGGGWVSANRTVLTVDVSSKGLYWAQNHILIDHGLQWNVVVVEAVVCDRGFYPTLSGYDATAVTGADCLECPEGAICLGGNLSPVPLPGYWVDRGEYSRGGDVYACVFETCVGASAKDENLACFSRLGFNQSACEPNELMCSKGSYGPLCGT